MASVSPPRPPAPEPSLPGRSHGSARATPNSPARAVAIGALVLVLLVVAYLVFAGSSGATYKLEFEDAGQLVKGDQVEVGGVRVGEIKDIQLSATNKALITIHVNSSLTPLHEGTTGEIRVPSLSSVANRYIMLSPGPNNAPALSDGATLRSTHTRGVVDLDQIFNSLDPKTRKGLQGLIEGSAEQYAGAEAAVNASTEYFGPSLNAISHVFAELSSDEPTLTRFLIEAGSALQVVGAHSGHLADLIASADRTFQAIGTQQTALAAALNELPRTLAAGSETFTELPSTFRALRELVLATRPATQPMIKFFARLRPLLVSASPVVHDLSLAVDRPGASNDLTDVALALPALARSLSTGSPNTVRALEESVPVTAMFGPYAPDLTGLFRDFGQDTAYYDANGHYARVSPTFGSFVLGEHNNLSPGGPQQAVENLKTGQLRRCPGGATQPAADGSSPFTDEGKLGCDPSETP